MTRHVIWVCRHGMLLFAALSAFAGLGATAAELDLRGQYRWRVDHPDFGGLSGLWVSDTGTSLIAVTDQGSYISGSITRDSGRIAKIALDEIKPLPLVNNREPTAFLLDAEGLAVAQDGSFYVSYEAHHRVWRFEQGAQNPQWTHKWDNFWNLQRNSGFEALAIDAEGTVYAIPERSGAWERPFPVHRLKDGAWDQPFALPRSKRFLVVGADFGPDGKLYLLERDFEMLRGFRSRIRRFTPTQSGLENEETLLETTTSKLENSEGISVWKDSKGQLVITLVSDNNFIGFLGTLVTEYTLR